MRVPPVDWSRAVVGVRSVAGASAIWFCGVVLLLVILTARWGIDDSSAMDGGFRSRRIARLPKGAIRALAWSPEGRTLAIAGGGSKVSLWDSATGEIGWIAIEDSTTNPTTVGLAWSTDGRTLAVANRSGSISRWDVETSECVIDGKSGRREIRAAGWSADLGSLAVSPVPDGVEVRDHTEGRSRGLDGSSDRGFGSLSFSPDGRTLVSAGQFEVVRSWDLATGALRFESRSRGFTMMNVVHSPGGDCFVTCGIGGPLQVWNASTGRELREIGPDVGGYTAIAFSKDGRWLASGRWDGSLRIWEAATGREIARLKDESGQVNALAWSPDGRSLASGNFEGVVRLWDVAEQLTLARNDL